MVRYYRKVGLRYINGGAFSVLIKLQGGEVVKLQAAAAAAGHLTVTCAMPCGKTGRRAGVTLSLLVSLSLNNYNVMTL